MFPHDAQFIKRSARVWKILRPLQNVSSLVVAPEVAVFASCNFFVHARIRNVTYQKAK